MTLSAGRVNLNDVVDAACFLNCTVSALSIAFVRRGLNTAGLRFGSSMAGNIAVTGLCLQRDALLPLPMSFVDVKLACVSRYNLGACTSLVFFSHFCCTMAVVLSFAETRLASLWLFGFSHGQDT